MYDLEGVRYIDISPELSAETAVFPGDKKFSRNVQFDMEKGDHMTLSHVETTLHIGAHADAPSHYQKSGEGISERSLDYYIGPCQVIDVSSKVTRGGMIVSQDIEHLNIETTRVIFKTSTCVPNEWNDDFCYLSEALLKELVALGVKLVGIDTPSIDKSDSKNLESHKIISENNMSILEGVDLSLVDEGKYQLIALPLKIKDGDASPVRAILIPAV